MQFIIHKLVDSDLKIYINEYFKYIKFKHTEYLVNKNTDSFVIKEIQDFYDTLSTKLLEVYISNEYEIKKNVNDSIIKSVKNVLRLDSKNIKEEIYLEFFIKEILKIFRIKRESSIVKSLFFFFVQIAKEMLCLLRACKEANLVYSKYYETNFYLYGNSYNKMKVFLCILLARKMLDDKYFEIYSNLIFNKLENFKNKETINVI